MKKFLSFAVAFAVALSSLGMTAVAETPTVNREIATPISVTLGTNANYTKELGDGTVEFSSSTTSFDAKTVIDMSGIADAWNAYVEEGMVLLSTDDRNDVLELVSLNGEFTLSVTLGSTISNSTPELEWNDNVLTYFENKEADPENQITVEDNTYTTTMKIKTGVTNPQLDAYFTADELEELAVEVKDNSIEKGTSAITAVFDGWVTISAPTIVGLENESLTVGVYGEDSGNVKRKSSSGGGGGGYSTPKPTTTPTAEPTETPTPTESTEPTTTPGIPGESTATPEAPEEIATTVKPQLGGTASGAKLNYVDHYAYIIGYDEADGSSVVRPENPITRAEVATIFYRLLTDESRNKFRTQESSFTDVNIGDWFNNNIATVAAAGIVNGYDDGTFGPNKKITRAEFATIASRFSAIVHEGENMFPDTTGHWAAQEINNAAATGWINGYDDGSFKPEAEITRAEAITMINRILYRYVQKDDIHEDSINWKDNTEDKWYYEEVQEATSSHDYNRKDIGYYEAHIETTPPYDWESHEK